MATHCIIPLRRDSVSIPNKNITLLNGKHLFRWCLDELLSAKIADTVTIATNIPEIKDIISLYYSGLDINIFWRSETNATALSPSIDVVKEFLFATNLIQEPHSWMVLVQATSPFTTKGDFLKMKSKIVSSRYDSLLSCVRLKKFRWSEDGVSLDYTWDSKPRRQDYQGFLVESGAFYGSRIKNIIATGKITSGNTGIIELGEEAMFEIDEPFDWLIAEQYLEFKARH